MRYCRCGCGRTTKSRFAPGHDAKLKSRLLQAARLGDELAVAELQRLGWAHFLTRTACVARGRKFGIELEIVHSDRYQLAEALRTAGIEVSVETYNHQTRNHWKLVPDGSVSGGFELVSPVLRGETGFGQIETVCRVLDEQGATVNTSCGFHCHHEIRDLDVAAVKRLVFNYAAAQDRFDAMMPASRRQGRNSYCQRHSSYDLEFIQTSTTIEQIAAGVTRYRTLNLNSYPRYGTVEFRQAAGTVEYWKIRGWILTGQQLVEAAKDGRTMDDWSEVLTGEALTFCQRRLETFERRAA